MRSMHARTDTGHRRRTVVNKWFRPARSTSHPATIDEVADGWLKRSLLYEVLSSVGDLKRDAYLSVVEGIIPARPPTGSIPRIIHR